MNKAELHKVISQFENDFENLQHASDFYDLEERVASIFNKLGLRILECEAGTINKDRRKKKPYYLVTE